MKRIKLFVKKNYIIIIPFFATLFLYLINIALNKIYPFGSQTFIYSDMSEQYATYFDYLKNYHNIFGSFSFTLGQNFYGIFSYFCASPLNVIFLFCTRKLIPIFVIALVALKMALASMSMAILLRSKLKNNLSILLFSVIYGLISYNIVYSIHIMWLDPMYLLPLIVLGLERMLKGKPLLYIGSLTLAICSNYYNAFPVCIFLIFYFIYLQLVNKENFKINLYNFIKYSIIAVLLSSVILIPTAFNMFNGKLETTEADFSFKLLYNPIYLIYRFLVGDSKNVIEDMPNFASSLLVLTFLLTFLFNKNITIKDKIYSFLTLSLLILITMFACTNTVMHCFRLPNHFPFRYSFIISFFMILMASKNFDDFNVNKRNILMYLLLGFIFYKYLSLYFDFKTVISSGLILIYFLSCLFIREKRLLGLLIIPILIGEILINISSTFGDFERLTYKQYITRYQYADEIDAIKPKQNEFYRITGLDKVTFNDSLIYGYYGVTSFSPTNSVNANRLLKDYFGEPLNPSYAIDYLVRTDFTDSFLNVKYYYKYDDGIKIFENKNVFPIMFKINQNERFKESKHTIENQNSLYQYLSDSDDNLFERIDNYRIDECNLEDLYLNSESNGYCRFYPTTKEDKNYIEIDTENFEIIPSYDIETSSENYGYRMLFDLNQKSQIFLLKQKVKLDFIASYKMDEVKLEKLSKVLNDNGVNITSHGQSKISGTISNDLENQIIFTTIPYDDGWHVSINGVEVETFKNLDSLLAFNLPKGESNIELYFIPKGYILGLTISLLTFDILVATYVRKNKEN